MKKLLIVSSLILVVIGIVCVVGYYVFTGPTYRPGMVRDEQGLDAPLQPPSQSGSSQGLWKVTNDIELFHFTSKRDVSDKARTVLVIHGGPGWPYIDPWSADLLMGENYRLQYYHQRGSGRSTRPVTTLSEGNTWEKMQRLDKTLGLAAQIADIERIRRILGEQKLLIIGHSFGGLMASLYAAEFPEHVEALVLVAPAALVEFPAEHDDLFESIARKIPPDRQLEFEQYVQEYLDFSRTLEKTDADLAAFHGRMGEYFELAYGNTGGKANQPPRQDQNGGFAHIASYISMGMRHDYSQALKNVTVPVLVLQGEQDLQSVDVSRQFSSYFPNGRLESIPDAGHFPFESTPEVFANKVREFFNSLQRDEPQK